MIRSNRGNHTINWLKWSFILIIIILLVMVTYFLILFNNIEKNKIVDFDKTVDFVLNETDITEIEAINQFQYEEAFHIVFGKTNKQEQLIIFIPLEQNKDDFVTIDESKIISKDKLLNEWEAQCEDCKLFNITPAMLDDEPLWEITYKDSSNQYIFNYVSIYDGEPYEKFKLKQMF